MASGVSTVTIPEASGTCPEDLNSVFTDDSNSVSVSTSDVFESTSLTVNGAVGYGGSVELDEEKRTFTFTATQDGTYNYVLDQVFVDGVALDSEGIQGEAYYVWSIDSLASSSTGDANASEEFVAVTGVHSVVATFAYILNF